VLEPDPDGDDAGWRAVGAVETRRNGAGRIYTGVGSRLTPAEVLERMIEIGAAFAAAGWTLRTGAGAGADQAFERGAEQARGVTEVCLPWAGFNEHASPLYEPPQAAFDLAATVHPAWARLSDRARRLHARNVQQVLGTDLRSPSALVVCWTPDGADREEELSRETGGTATAIAVACRWGVPVHNLLHPQRIELVLQYVRGMDTALRRAGDVDR
jgi:hypothetical protein